MNTTSPTVFVVDDDAAVLRALSRLLSANGYEVRGFCSAQDFLAQYDPGVVGCAVLDLVMPDLDGLQLQSALSHDSVPRPVIFLSGRGDIPAVVKAMKTGAVDFLRKPVKPDDLLSAVTSAVERDTQARQCLGERMALAAKLARLTPRECQVLSRVIAGQLNKQIAGDLGTGVKTIKVHRGRVMHKLGVRSVADLVRVAESAGVAPHRQPGK